MSVFEIDKTKTKTDTKINWYEAHNCVRLMDLDKWLKDNSVWMKISHSLDDKIIQTAIDEKVFTVKSYMNMTNLENSIIVKTLLKDCNYICNELGISLNCALRGICYLFMSYNGVDSIKLPDKKLAFILKTNKQKCHLFAERISYILSDYFNIKLDLNKGYYTYKVDKDTLSLDDPFILDISEYLFYKYLKPINKESNKFKNRMKRIWKKYKYVEFKKLDKRKNKYYENSLYSEVTSRECFKILFIGLSWYYTKLVEPFITPESLLYIREINGERKDIYYLENPIFILQDITGLNGIELTKHINAIVGGMGTLMYKHDLSYVNIVEPDQEFNPIKKDQYQNLELVKHSKLLVQNGEIIKNEAYRASIQGFQTTSFSYILKPEYFNTKLGKIILENKDTFLAIIKKYFENHLEGDANYDYYNKIIEDKKIKADIYPIILSPDQIRHLLDNELKDIDTNDIEIKNNMRILLNKDKLLGLPEVKARGKRQYSFGDCMQRDKHDKIKLDDDKKIILKSPEACTYVLYKLLNQISGNDIKSNCAINITYGNGKKVFDENTLNNLDDLISVFKETSHKKEFSNLGYNIKQFNMCRDVIINRFKQGFNGCIEDLKKLVMCIRRFHLGSCFADCAELRPYMKYFY